jgi:hypothetical protein
MKHALPMDIIKIMPSYRARRDSVSAKAAVRHLSRIQGGNWSMQGIRRSGRVHDEDECQLSIAEFMAKQEPSLDSGDA